MKNLFISIIFGLFTLIATGQKKNNIKKVSKGGLTEVTIYYNNGEVMQHGSYDAEGKLHGQWESYNEDGSKKCIAFYNNNVKTGTWIYWTKGEVNKVTYNKNKIVSIEKMSEAERIKKEY